MALDEYILGKLDKLDARIRQLENEANDQHDRINKIDEAYVSVGWFNDVLGKLHPETNADEWWEDIWATILVEKGGDVE